MWLVGQDDILLTESILTGIDQWLLPVPSSHPSLLVALRTG